MSDELTTLAPGATFQGRYEIVRRIARGGMGAVYECIHIKTRRRRALKVMHPQIVADPMYRARFELEARVTAEIETEHIVETFDAGIDDETGWPFLVMELLRGEDLRALLKRRGRLHPAEVVEILTQASRALDKTHAANIVHRDLKPENLFVTAREDGTLRIKILDFGVAKVVAHQSKTVGTGVIGTPLYMSPEQISADGAIGPASDLYALAHIAYTLLAGQAYWHAEERAAPSIYPFLMRVMQGPPEAPSARAARGGAALTPAFDAWFARAAASTPAARFESASALAAALGAALGVSPRPLPFSHTGASEGGSSGQFHVSPSGSGPVFTPQQPLLTPSQAMLASSQGSLTPSHAAFAQSQPVLTPTHGSHSPSQLPPMPAQGSMTPLQGSMTPSQGSMTPSQGSNMPSQAVGDGQFVRAGTTPLHIAKLGQGDTGSPVAHEPAGPPRQSSAVVLIVGGLISAAALGGSLALVLRHDDAPKGRAAAASASIAASAETQAEAPSGAKPPASSDEPAAPAPSGAPPAGESAAASAAPAAPTVEPLAPAPPHAQESAPPPSPKPQKAEPRATAQKAEPAKPGKPAKAAPNCSPPFTIDAAGDKHIKPGCD